VQKRRSRPVDPATFVAEGEWRKSLSPVDRPLVPWRELRALSTNALRRSVLNHFDPTRPRILRDELDRFLLADQFFFLSAARALVTMKEGLWFDARLEQDSPLSTSESARARRAARFLEYDYFSLLMPHCQEPRGTAS
jgi:hypothetical protein